MNYSELQQIIKHLRKNLPCSNCSQKFNENDMAVVTTFENEGIFHLDCNACHNQLLVHVAIVSAQRKHRSLETGQIGGDPISKNDILDMHNFLGQFNGDFRALFA